MAARYVLETYIKRKLNLRKLLWRLVGVTPDTPQLWPLSKLAIHDPFHLGRDREGLLPYEIPNSFRKTHTYVIGKSGKGKSKLLEHMLVKDVMAGRGCCVIDPHGDLAEELLPAWPVERHLEGKRTVGQRLGRIHLAPLARGGGC